MVVLSKLYKECVQHSTCHDIIHTGTCTRHAINNLYRYFISNSKYYAPLMILPLILKIRKINRNLVKDALTFYIRCVLCGTAIGLTVQTMMCVFRNYFGEFGYYTFAFVPSLIGSLHSMWAKPRVQQLHHVNVFQGIIESFILRRKNMVTKTIADSLLIQTMLFMCSSALILDAKQKGASKAFWILRPNKNLFIEANVGDKPQQKIQHTLEPRKTCAHTEQSCNLFLVKGIRGYLALGLVLDLVKALMSKVAANNVGFRAKFLAKLGNLKLRSTALLSAYIGIYRFTHCYLNRKSNANPVFNHQIASLLSGVCFIFQPQFTLLSYALVLSIQILWQKLETYKSDDATAENWYWKHVKAIPFAKIIFPFCLAHLIHACVLRKSSISNLADMIINGTTDNHARLIGDRIQKLEKILESKLKQ